MITTGCVGHHTTGGLWLMGSRMDGISGIDTSPLSSDRPQSSYQVESLKIREECLTIYLSYASFS